MQEEELQTLIEKYLNGTASLPEREKLDQWYRQKNEQEVVWMSDDQEEKEKVERQMLSVIHHHVRSEKSANKVFPFKIVYSIAAVIAACCLIFGYYFFNYNTVVAPQAKALLVSTPAKIDENRFILLPDSSTVILHPGSSIRYSQIGHERRLVLNGEAYFDIRHLSGLPFVIITGSVKTTVLGTAFNIRAYAGQEVTVSVTRGKVSVMNSLTKALAILLPNQQATLSGRNQKLNLKTRTGLVLYAIQNQVYTF